MKENVLGVKRVVVPEAMAALDDIQAMVTVCAGILSENPALSKAYNIRNN